MELHLKISKIVDIASPLNSFVGKRIIGNDLIKLNTSINEAALLRNKIIRVSSFSEEAVLLYIQYYEYVEQLCYAFPVATCIRDLCISWTDIFGNTKIITSDLNVERASVLLNLAVLYYSGAEDYIHSSDRDKSKWNALDLGRKSVAVVNHIIHNIVPLLDVKVVTWDLVPQGISAIEKYLRARCQYFMSLEANTKSESILKVTRYVRRESVLYGDCINDLKMLPYDFSRIISKLEFLQLFCLLSGYVSLARNFVEGFDLTSDNLKLLSAVMSVLSSSFSMLLNSDQYKTAVWKSHVDMMASDIEEIKGVLKYVGINSYNNVNIDEALKTVSPLSIPEIDPFTYPHQLPPLFDSLLTETNMASIDACKRVLHEFCRNSSVQVTSSMQDVSNRLASIDTSMLLEGTGALLESLSHVDSLVSSGQLTLLQAKYDRLEILRSSCAGMMGQLDREVVAELQEELMTHAQNADIPVHEDYLQRLRVWISSTQQYLSTKDETVVMCSQQLALLAQRCSSVQQTRRRLESLGQQASTPVSEELQRNLDKVKAMLDSVEEQRSHVTRLSNRLSKLTSDDIAIRLALRRSEVEGMQMYDICLYPAKALMATVTQVLGTLWQTIDELRSVCNDVESEMKKDLNYSERCQLLDSINYIDKTFSSCGSVTDQNVAEYENLSVSLASLLKDFNTFKISMKEQRTMITTRSVSSSPDSVMSSQGQGCQNTMNSPPMRSQSLTHGISQNTSQNVTQNSPIMGQNNQVVLRNSSGSFRGSDSAAEKVFVPQKGWTCCVCGIVNDMKTVICDGCFQRRI